MKKLLYQYTQKHKVLLCLIAILMLAILCLLIFRHIHSYGEWELYKEPSCNSYGIERRYCNCGEMQDRRLDMLDHTEGDWEFDEINSLRQKRCTVCQSVITTESLTNHSHTFGEWITVQQVTCTTNGLQSRACDCGFKQEEIIKAPGHTFNDWETIIYASCSEVGLKKRSCPCGHSEIQEIDTLEHITGNWILNGIYKEYPCINCGDILKSEAIKTSSGLNINGSSIAGIGTCNDVDIVIPEEVDGVCIDSINKKAFQYSNSINSVIIPNTVKFIGDYTFYEASSLKNIHLGNGITDIGEHAFGSCANLQEISIPEGVTVLRENTFEYCSSLHSVSLPNTLESLEALVFFYCSSLTDIYFNGSVDEWNSIEKHENWSVGTDSYTIHCTDGNIKS